MDKETRNQRIVHYWKRSNKRKSVD